MNIRYFGPADGHNVVELVRILRELKDMRGPRLLHIHTVKGKGFEPAEKHATIWHAPGKFDKESGCRLEQQRPDAPPRFQDVFGETLVELARENDKIVGVTPAMATGCSMNILMEEMPDRVFDVGIAEGHAVTFSAGMAKDGLQPFCNIYSSFAQRAYDNIIHDAALLGLNVVLCLDRAGLVGEDGPTHHGAFDLAALRPIPNLTIASPYDEHELRRLMATAAQKDMGTFVIRYPRGRGRLAHWRCPLETVSVGKGRRLKDGKDVAVLTLGPIGNVAADAIAEVEKEHGVSVAHYDMRFLKPLDTALLDEVAQRFKRVVTVEDGARLGGFGSAVLEYFADKGVKPDVVRLGLPDNFVEHGKPEELYRIVGLDKDTIKKALL
jgi:1-deoxy-D-xylulose-5-phosphate synthase